MEGITLQTERSRNKLNYQLVSNGLTSKKLRKKWHASDWQFFSMASLGVIFLIIFNYLPMFGILLAFRDGDYEIDILNATFNAPWVGFDNFLEFFLDDEFGNIIMNTLGLNSISLVVNFIEDKTLTTWQNDTNNNRRLIIESDYLNDRSLFHINDPTVIDLGNGHLRAYFEMESLNKPSSFIKLGSTSSLSDDKVSNLEAADDTEEGIPIHGIAMAESFNGGQTWQGVNSQKEGKVTRDDYVFIEGINIYSYAYWQIGWPSIVKLGDKFIMYFNMFARADFTNKKVSTAKTWKQYWRNERVEIDFNFSSNVGPAGNLVVCESDDGKNFKFIGSVTNAMDRSGAYCYNPDVKKIDEETLLITYNSDTFEYNNEGVLEKNILSSWGTGLSYIKADKLTNVYQINRNSQNTMSTEALAFYPYLFGGDRRSSVTPQLLQNAQGDVIGIGYGQWQTPGNSNSYIAAAYLQNYALIKQNGKTVAGVNLSKNPDEAIIVSHSDSSFVSNGEVMISYNSNNLNVNKISKIKNATIEIYNIYGEKLLQTKPFTLKVGDKFVLKKI